MCIIHLWFIWSPAELEPVFFFIFKGTKCESGKSCFPWNHFFFPFFSSMSHIRKNTIQFHVRNALKRWYYFLSIILHVVWCMKGNPWYMTKAAVHSNLGIIQWHCDFISVCLHIAGCGWVEVGGWVGWWLGVVSLLSWAWLEYASLCWC